MGLAKRGMAAVVVSAAMVFGTSGVASAKPQPNTPKAAVVAFKALVTQLNNYHYSAAWHTLHPAQQAVVPRSVYVRCAANAPVVMSDLKVLSSGRESFTIPGTKVTTPSVALSVKATYTSGDIRQRTAKIFHEIYVKGSWRWTLTNPELYTSDC
jgi:hypothetical protein